MGMKLTGKADLDFFLGPKDSKGGHHKMWRNKNEEER
jgi:hypothetical protein